MKKQIKILFVVLMLLLTLTSLTYADQTCYTGEECQFTTVAINTSEYFYNGIVTNTIFNEDGFLYLNQEMTKIDVNGSISYQYNYTFNETGVWTRISKADTKISAEQITVKDISETTLAGLIISNWTMIIIVILIIVVVGLFALITKKK